MNRKVKFGLVFVAGYLVGDFTKSKLIQKKLYVLLPLLEKSVREVTIKAIENDLSEEEISELMADEYCFLKIVTKK